MIGQLRGNLISRAPHSLIVDVRGVGYQVTIAPGTYQKVPAVGSEVVLKIYTHVREDQLQLYGFLSDPEKEFFLALLSVNGIGPKVALTIVSEISTQELSQVIITGNTKRLSSVPGIGTKTAERIVLEMKGKIKKLSFVADATDAPHQSDAFYDLSSALSNLGYKQSEIDRTILKLNNSDPALSFEDLLKRSLKLLRG